MLQYVNIMEIKLADLEPGKTGMVRRLEGGRSYVARLAALGFTIGAPVKVLRKNARGPLLVSLRGTQIALGFGEAEGIEVTPEAESKEAPVESNDASTFTIALAG